MTKIKTKTRSMHPYVRMYSLENKEALITEMSETSAFKVIFAKNSYIQKEEIFWRKKDAQKSCRDWFLPTTIESLSGVELSKTKAQKSFGQRKKEFYENKAKKQALEKQELEKQELERKQAFEAKKQAFEKKHGKKIDMSYASTDYCENCDNPIDEKKYFQDKNGKLFCCECAINHKDRDSLDLFVNGIKNIMNPLNNKVENLKSILQNRIDEIEDIETIKKIYDFVAGSQGHKMETVKNCGIFFEKDEKKILHFILKCVMASFRYDEKEKEYQGTDALYFCITGSEKKILEKIKKKLKYSSIYMCLSAVLDNMDFDELSETYNDVGDDWLFCLSESEYSSLEKEMLALGLESGAEKVKEK
jgi:hypothetical protein